MKICLVTLTLFLTLICNNAFAAEMLYVCRDQKSGIYGLWLVIEKKDNSHYVASLSNHAEDGAIEKLEDLSIGRKPMPVGIMGAPVEYDGENFSLTMYWDGGPEDGFFPSMLQAEVGSRRLDQEMYCSIVRPNP